MIHNSDTDTAFVVCKDPPSKMIAAKWRSIATGNPIQEPEDGEERNEKVDCG